jgi:hypothetical protein
VAALLGAGLSFLAIPDAKGTDRTAEAREPTDGADRGVTVLELHSDATELDFEALRAAIAAELGVEVVAQTSERAERAVARVTVSYRPGAHELAVSYATPARGTITRVVEAPSASSEALTTAVLLAGNLAQAQVATAPPAAVSPPPPAPAAQQPVPAAQAQISREPPPPRRFANASLFYPLATNLDEPELCTHLSLNVLFGRIGELSGLELGAVNVVGRRLEGFEAAVFGNWVGGPVSGLQLAGGFNIAQSLEGLQLTFGLNHFERPSSGAQLAFLANVGGSTLSGVQLASFNRAGDVRGVQVGLVNVARKVSGLQVGLINVADDVDGVPIGLVSVTRSGGIHSMFWASTATYGNLGLKFATRYTYTFLSVSAHSDGEYEQAGPGLGLGFSVPVTAAVFFEPDVSALHLFANTGCCSDPFWSAYPRRHDETQFKLRASLSYALARRLSVFVGGGIVGRVRYPLDETGEARAELSGSFEGFGGLQL